MSTTWTFERISALYHSPLPDLIFRAQTEHRKHFDACEIQRSTLLSIKTGGCPENCAYCPQSAHHETAVKRQPLLDRTEVLEKARAAKAEGSTRFCMGAAWRQVKDGPEFDQVLELVRSVRGEGLEVCCTLGMLNESQAQRLKEAGCYAYNHNLDTSPEYYEKIISTRKYQDRLDTLQHVRQAGLSVCCGGIVGMGESVDDRLKLLEQLALQDPPPESVPINMLVRVEGTPLAEDQGVTAVTPFEFVRMIATARIMLPQSRVRLSAGRMQMSDELQALCFLAGANSIFAGEKLLTTENPSWERDRQLVEALGMHFKELQAEDTNSEPSHCKNSCAHAPETAANA
jgi:biotin synthase